MKKRGRNLSLAVVGSVAFDDIDGPYGLQKDLLGGSASFISTVASYFTSRVSLIAVVGEDFPAEHVEFFDSRGIDLRGLKRSPGKTFRWVGKYSEDLNSRETLDTQLGVFADFQPKLEDDQRRVDLLFLGNIDPALQLDVLEQVERPGLVAADTMNFWIGGKRSELLQVLKKLDVLLINDEEARELAGIDNLVAAAAEIRKMGPKSLVVKRGDSGAYLFYEGGVFATPALPLEEVRDPTGAGDSFAGGFMGYLAFAGSTEASAIRSAMISASAMASFSVEQFSLDGIRNLTPELIRARADEFYQLSAFERLAL